MMHGPSLGPGRQILIDALGALAIPPVTTQSMAERSLATIGFAFVPIEALSPDIAALLALRGVLGLRSPMNTVGRLLDPADATGSIDGVFHPAYIALHLAVAERLGRRIAVLKGGGGEAEWTGVKPLALNSRTEESIWPALEVVGKPTSQSPADLVSVWSRTQADPAAEAIVIATTAVALHAAGRAHGPAACIAMARALWDSRTVKP
jgi:anthranilate phosphoribosyltransferase